MTEVPSQSRQPASVRRRLAAYVLDNAIVAIVAFGAAALVSGFGPTMTVASQPDGTLRLLVDPLRLVGQAVAVSVVSLAYFAWSWSRPIAATPAQRALGIRVVDDGGHQLGVPRAMLRWLAMGMPIGIVAAAAVESFVAWFVVVALATTWTVVLLVSAWRHEQRRGLHDRVAGSVVVRTAS